MKVLIACRDNGVNPFVRTLVDAIKKNGVDIICSPKSFWDNWQCFDIIHFQWPVELLLYSDNIDNISNQFKLVKNAGKKIVTTCHNLHPHYVDDKLQNEVYDVLYKNSDVIIHMGEYSYNLFKTEYPNSIHKIIPHHIYNDLFGTLPSRNAAIEYLKLKKDHRYILCFGAFRNSEETELVEKVANYVAAQDYKVLTPLIYKYNKRRNVFLFLKDYIGYLLMRRKHSNFLFSGKPVPDKDIPFYYAASDVALIHRKEILNSGNLPMAFMMGKVVVGPAVGNVGAILNETKRRISYGIYSGLY